MKRAFLIVLVGFGLLNIGLFNVGCDDTAATAGDSDGDGAVDLAVDGAVDLAVDLAVDGADAGDLAAEANTDADEDDVLMDDAGDSDGTVAADANTDANTNTDEAYVLYSPNSSRETYLIDMDGQLVHDWTHSCSGGYSVYPLENGNILRPCLADRTYLNGGAAAGLIQEIDWDGNVVWEFEYNSSDYLTHHDLEPMPNGHILAIAWEVVSASDATAMGRENADEMWIDHVIEVAPEGNGGTVVWKWHARDHLTSGSAVSSHPELVDINLGDSRPGPGGGGGDWLHINGISYNPELDQIALSSHFMDEFYVIDHSTTTAEAAGHSGGDRGQGGDIIYRWGSPENYGASGTSDFDVIHCANWVPAGRPGAGNILVFNNGSRSRRSSIDEITPPGSGTGDYVLSEGMAWEPTALTWQYSASDFYSAHLGSEQRLANGNTFICEATSAHFIEVDPAGEVVWEYTHSGVRSEVARAYHLTGEDYPQFVAQIEGE